MKFLILFAIRFYQRVLSLDTGMVGNIFPGIKVCRFTPTCSEYTYEAIQRYGILKGSVLGFKRILRCNPFCKGGFDPVPSNQ